MSEPSTSVSSATESASSSNAAAATAAAGVNADTGGTAQSNADAPKMSDKISSMDDLRKKAPEVYQQTLMGLAQRICTDMQRQQERLKRAIRSGQLS